MNVVFQWFWFIVSTEDRICCCQYWSSCIKSGINSSFCNWDSLLLHCLVDSNLIFCLHLVELINATNSIICKHECSCLYSHISTLVSCNTCSQTCSWCSFSVCVDWSWNKLVDTFEKLTFSWRRVPNDKDINISSNIDFVLGFFVNTSNKLKKKCFFDLLVTIDCWEKRLSHILIEPRILFHSWGNYKLSLCHIMINLLPNYSFVKYSFWCLFVFLFIFLFVEKFIKLIIFNSNIDSCKNEFVTQISDSFKTWNPSLCLSHSSSFNASGRQLSFFSRFKHAWQLRQNTKIANDFTNISRLSFFCKLISKNNIDRTRHSSWRNFCGILLNSNFLKISELALRHL